LMIQQLQQQEQLMIADVRAAKVRVLHKCSCRGCTVCLLWAC
jgi:hypothetical protein